MGKLTEKAKNIKKIVSILKTLSAEYVKELVETLTDKTDDKYSLECRDVSKRMPRPVVAWCIKVKAGASGRQGMGTYAKTEINHRM